MNRGAWLGLAVMAVSEAATIARIEPFWSWNTPIAWTGFIVFADSIVWQARGDSWIRSNGREFALLALASIPLWLVFEAYNLTLRNWNYTGLPENRALRLFGYAWSFATISPALFEGAELIAVSVGSGFSPTGRSTKNVLESRLSWASIALGAAMLVSPFLVPAPVAPYMAAPVWLGFIFLLDPINASLGAESISGDLRAGRGPARVINLALSGLLCGILWEFWNYWARAKWHYTVPIGENLKMFEMPLPGYLGFPPFAVECFTMYVFLRVVFHRIVRGPTGHSTQLGRTIAL
jgi:hypothetical protein